MHTGKATVIAVWEKVLNCIPLKRIFRGKNTFLSETFHSLQIGVLLNIPKQVRCPSSPSFPFSRRDNAYNDHNIQLIIQLENTLRWLSLATLFPCFLRVGMRVLSPYTLEGKQPESGGKCHPNIFPCQLGEWEDLGFSTSGPLL